MPQAAELSHTRLIGVYDQISESYSGLSTGLSLLMQLSSELLDLPRMGKGPAAQMMPGVTQQMAWVVDHMAADLTHLAAAKAELNRMRST